MIRDKQTGPIPAGWKDKQRKTVVYPDFSQPEWVWWPGRGETLPDGFEFPLGYLVPDLHADHLFGLSPISWTGEGDTNYGLGPGVSPTDGNYGLGGDTSQSTTPESSTDIANALGLVGMGLGGISGFIWGAAVGRSLTAVITNTMLGAALGGLEGYAGSVVGKSLWQQGYTTGIASKIQYATGSMLHLGGDGTITWQD